MKQAVVYRLSLLETVTITTKALLAGIYTGSATIQAISDSTYPQAIWAWLLTAWHSWRYDYTGSATVGAVAKPAFAVALFTIDRGWIHTSSIEALKLPSSTTIRAIFRVPFKSCRLFLVHFGLPYTQLNQPFVR